MCPRDLVSRAWGRRGLGPRLWAGFQLSQAALSAHAACPDLPTDKTCLFTGRRELSSAAFVTVTESVWLLWEPVGVALPAQPRGPLPPESGSLRAGACGPPGRQPTGLLGAVQNKPCPREVCVRRLMVLG